MSSQSSERTYYLVETDTFKSLLRTHFVLLQSTLLFCAAKATVRCSSHRIKFVRLWGSTAINWSNTDVSALLGNTVKLSPKKRRKMPP